MHCGQQVESQNSVRTVKKRNRDVAFEDVSVLCPEMKKPKPPPMTETLKFARGVIRDGTSSSKVGDGVLVTEQTLLEQDKDTGGVKSVNVGFSVIDRNGQKIDDATKDSIAQVFKNLSAVLMPSSVLGNRGDTKSPENVLAHLKSFDNRVMLMCLFALATGHTDMESFCEMSKKKGKNTDNCVMAIGMATDLVVRAVNSNDVGPAVKCASNMFRHGAHSVVADTLLNFRVVTSRSAAGRASASEHVKACVEPEVEIGVNDLVMLTSDNANWKVTQGREGGTVESWSLIAHRLASEEDLASSHYGDNKLSREPERDWNTDVLDQMSQDEVVSSFFEGRETDFKSLKELLFIHMKAVLLCYKDLSDIDYKRMDESGEYGIQKGTPKLERVFEEKDLDMLVTPLAQPADDDYECASDAEDVGIETLFKKNKIVPSIPSELNFASRETIVELFEYLIRVGEIQRVQYEKMKADGYSGPPPISVLALLFAGDGDPIKTGLNIKATDPEGRCKRILLLLGIFHAFMEIFKKSNQHDKDMTSFLVAPLYAKKDKAATDKNLSYFLNFNDPTQPEKDVGTAITAILLKALFEMKKGGRVDATPATLHKFMADRAENSPQDMRMFLLLHYWTLVLLFRKAERCNKIDLYFACMRLSLPLLAVENATNYILIFTELLKHWETCSVAEKDLMKKYGFVLETPNGIFVGVDYGHEKYVRLVRDETGKVKRRGLESKIEHAALCRPGKQATQGIKSKKQYKGRDLKHCNGEGLTKVLLVLESIGAWSEDSSTKTREPDTDAVYSMQKFGEMLPRELLHTDSIGTELVSQYVKKFTCTREPVTERTGTGLFKRDYSADGANDLLKKSVSLATSLNKRTLMSEGTTDQLKAEILRLQPHVSEGFPNNVDRIGTKPKIAETLLSLRKKAFETNIVLLAQFETDAKERALGGKSTADNRREELQRKWFATEPHENERLVQCRVEL